LKHAACLAAAVSLIACAAQAAESPPKSPTAASEKPSATATASPNRGVIFSPESVISQGSVTVGGTRIDYHAVAGTIVVHPKGWDDAAAREAQDTSEGDKATDKDLDDDSSPNPKAEASMFYVAYFKDGVPSADRPITFLYNGGPGSSSMWLHMGAWGPRRVITADDSHTPAAPYRLVDNAYSLLDVSDLVFIDAPGTGFSRIAGKDKEKAFYGADPDVYAFDQFILGFLSQYGRWNSPKYLFGESYGTPRSAMLVNQLETDQNLDFNGVILLSAVLNFDLGPDDPQFNPGTDEPYIVALPTYAATAWYHDRLPGPKPDLDTLLKQVEQFATTDYASALQQGSELSPEQRQTIAQRLAQFTGLPVAYILKANLRINGGEFEKMLQDPEDLTTGRLDTRFSGPSLDPLSKEAGYDPQSAAISSAYLSVFNDYVRQKLGFGGDRIYKSEIDVDKYWSYDHQPPGADEPQRGIMNVLPDLASAMKYDPQLKVLLLGGYFDLATPFYAGWYDMHHLPIPASLAGNIQYRYYRSGHMVYAHEPSLQKMHDDVAAFIRQTDNLGG